MQIANYQEATKYLESFIGQVRYRIDKEFLKRHDPLERMRVLLSLLGNPQDKFRSILVGGTSGKGSTAYLISHILTTGGYKTGLTVSPHLQKVSERVQISEAQSAPARQRVRSQAKSGGKLKAQKYLPTGDLPKGDGSKVKSYSVNQLEPISDVEFIDLLNQVIPAVEQMKGVEIGAPSYFEILIAMAFKYFADQKVDIAVVEVGMGGEFDATNTLYPLIAVITNVSLDHTNILGRTLQKIARTKAGIIKSIRYKVLSSKYKNDLVVVAGVKQPSVIRIVEDKCKEIGAEVLWLGKDFDYRIKEESLQGSVFDFYSCHPELVSGSSKFGNEIPKQVWNDNMLLSLLGRHQIENASLAIETALKLQRFGFKVLEKDIRKALKTAFFPGRFEYIIHNTKYKILLDGAHNPTKMRKFLTSLKKLFPKKRKIFVVGFKYDKDAEKMLREISEVADQIVITQFQAKTDTRVNGGMGIEKIKNVIEKFANSYRHSGNPPAGGASRISSGDKRFWTSQNDEKVDIFYEENSKQAMDKAYEMAGKSDLIVVTGSLYLVGEVRSML